LFFNQTEQYGVIDLTSEVSKIEYRDQVSKQNGLENLITPHQRLKKHKKESPFVEKVILNSFNKYPSEL
jgi:hypothetical protein